MPGVGLWKEPYTLNQIWQCSVMYFFVWDICLILESFISICTPRCTGVCLYTPLTNLFHLDITWNILIFYIVTTINPTRLTHYFFLDNVVAKHATRHCATKGFHWQSVLLSYIYMLLAPRAITDNTYGHITLQTEPVN